MAINKRKVQEINAGSMADISFLLLIFFLVATTMNTDTGLMRMLPPMPPENQQQEEIKVKERNLFLVLISGSGNIMAGVPGKQEQIVLGQLKDMAKEFITNPMDDENLPEKVDREIDMADGSKWTYPVLYHGAERTHARIQRSARRRGPTQIRRKVLGAQRGSAQCSVQSSAPEDFGGRTA